MNKVTSNNLKDTDNIAKAIANATQQKGALICLYGDIGAGKTTLTQSIAKYLGVEEKVTSPTFVILNEYHSGAIPLYHFDLYRLEEEGTKSILDELREYSEAENVLCLVEWADFYFDEMPEDRIELKIEYLDENSRSFEFKAFGNKHEEIVKEILK